MSLRDEVTAAGATAFSTYEQLDPADLTLFREFTYARYAEQAIAAPDGMVAIGAFRYGVCAAGLALGRVGTGEKTGSGDLLSLSVALSCRGAVIERELLGHFESAMHRRGCRALRFVYTEETHGYLTGTLAAAGWSSPQPRFALHTVPLEKLLAETAVFRRDLLPAGCTFFPLRELATVARERFMDLLRPEEQPPAIFIDPYRHLSTLEPSISVGVRCGEEPAGWVIATRTAPDRIAYNGLFVRQPWRGSPLACALMGEALRRQERAGIPLASCMIRHDNQAMAAMFRRRFSHAVSVTRHSVQVEKVLVLPAAPAAQSVPPW